MCFWHYSIIPSLSADQLDTQLTDCIHIAEDISVFGFPDDKTIHVAEYPIQQFRDYCNMIIFELISRDIPVDRSIVSILDKYIGFELDMTVLHNKLFPAWHTEDYLQQCRNELQCSKIQEVTTYAVC